jgi:outer membrane biosynthesis protein TonB
VTIGNLDKNIIRRFIRRSLPRIRYCYEKQLLLKPKLAGTVTVTFEIGTDGSVSRVDAKGITPAVSQCVGKTVGAIRFPKPQGGGVVSVRYPFSFSPSK